MNHSDDEHRLLAAGGTEIGPAAVARAIRFDHRGGTYHIVDLWSGARKVQLTISPTGRSVRVFVDGGEVKPWLPARSR